MINWPICQIVSANINSYIISKPNPFPTWSFAAAEYNYVYFPNSNLINQFGSDQTQGNIPIHANADAKMLKDLFNSDIKAIENKPQRRGKNEQRNMMWSFSRRPQDTLVLVFTLSLRESTIVRANLLSILGFICHC